MIVSFPDFYEQALVVRTYDPFAAKLGAARDGFRLSLPGCPCVWPGIPVLPLPMHF